MQRCCHQAVSSRSGMSCYCKSLGHKSLQWCCLRSNHPSCHRMAHSLSFWTFMVNTTCRLFVGQSIQGVRWEELWDPCPIKRFEARRRSKATSSSQRPHLDLRERAASAKVPFRPLGQCFLCGVQKNIWVWVKLFNHQEMDRRI